MTVQTVQWLFLLVILCRICMPGLSAEPAVGRRQYRTPRPARRRAA